MDPVVTSCVGCGRAIRIRRPDLECRRTCPVCGTTLGVSSAQAPAAPGSNARHRRRALVGPPVLLRIMLLMMISAPLAVWWTVQWTSTAAASSGFAGPRAVASSVPEVRLVTPADPLRSELILNAARRLASSGPIVRGLRLLAAVQDGLTKPARGDAIQAPPPPMPTIPGVLTPPDFGAVSPETLANATPVPAEHRFLLRDEDGRQMVARLHGCHDGKAVLVLPDGRLGVPSMLVPTDETFRPQTADEMAQGLLSGPFAGFRVHRTEHYLILYQSPEERPQDDSFAKSNGVLLEDLYRRLLEAFRKHDVVVHEAEFPLVAVIFKNEDQFRQYRPVAPDVQAYYEIYSNRIFLYEHPTGLKSGPEVDALLKPQMVAHEGTHQILQNIGVQPRLSDWPLWLVEGLAEYCATPAPLRKGVATWDGLGQINNLHMATLRELEDPVSLSMRGEDARTKSLFREPGQPLVEAMIRRTELTPTEYALAWAITHYLAMKRSDDFTRFLRIMASAPPLEPRTADDHVKCFRDVFGADLGKLDKTIYAYLTRLTKQKGYDPMPYYAVLFEQPLSNGRLRRAAMVSQSPQLIKQWVDEMSNAGAVLPTWQATPFPSRARATLAVQEWIHAN